MQYRRRCHDYPNKPHSYGRDPGRVVPRGTMLAEAERKLRKYEVRYEMSSEKMAALLELDAIKPTAEVIRWYSTYQGAKLLRAQTPTTGTPGTITETFTTAD